jgi:hypothetical protein
LKTSRIGQKQTKPHKSEQNRTSAGYNLQLSNNLLAGLRQILIVWAIGLLAGVEKSYRVNGNKQCAIYAKLFLSYIKQLSQDNTIFAK